MPYKDKEKAKQKAKERMRRNRANKSQGERENIRGEHVGRTGFEKVAALYNIKNYGQPDCECKHCQSNRANGSRHIINHGYKPASELGTNELNRVALPGDPDYVGGKS